jgi:hypothetical protein
MFDGIKIWFEEKFKGKPATPVLAGCGTCNKECKKKRCKRWEK